MLQLVATPGVALVPTVVSCGAAHVTSVVWRAAFARSSPSFRLHVIERWKWVDDVGERVQWDRELDGEHELAEDPPPARGVTSVASTDHFCARGPPPASARFSVKVVNVAADCIRGIGMNHDDVNATCIRAAASDKPTDATSDL